MLLLVPVYVWLVGEGPTAAHAAADYCIQVAERKETETNGVEGD